MYRGCLFKMLATKMKKRVKLLSTLVAYAGILLPALFPKVIHLRTLSHSEKYTPPLISYLERYSLVFSKNFVKCSGFVYFFFSYL